MREDKERILKLLTPALKNCSQCSDLDYIAYSTGTDPETGDIKETVTVVLKDEDNGPTIIEMDCTERKALDIIRDIIWELE